MAVDAPMLRPPGVYAPPPEKPGLSILSLVVAIFIIIFLAFRGGTLIKAAGIVMAFFYFIYAMRGGMHLYSELVLYAMWTMWSLLGAFGSISSVLFWDRWFTVAQILFLILIVSGHANSRRPLLFALGAILVGAAIVGSASVLSGSYRLAAAGEWRLTGVGMDVNEFGALMVLSSMAMMFFWMLPSRRKMLKYLFWGTLMFLAAVGTVLSGSRMAFLSLVVAYLLWLWFCYRKLMFHRLFLTVLVLVVVGIVVFVFYQVYVKGSFVMFRLEESWKTVTGEGVGESSTRIRINLLLQGLEVLKEHFFLGVGLNNFRVLSGGYAPHTDWTEVSVSTGLPGALLHYSVYAALWLRTRRILKNTTDPTMRQLMALIRATILVILFMGMGLPMCYNKGVWTILGSYIGYAGVVWNQLRRQMPEPKQTVPALGAVHYAGPVGSMNTRLGSGI